MVKNSNPWKNTRRDPRDDLPGNANHSPDFTLSPLGHNEQKSMYEHTKTKTL